ncbi:hypothetical protein SNEBB_010284 [Seison nebaliae]|nr:hypothetical protein SNEBB_010284 [Seison nebaliae]
MIKYTYLILSCILILPLTIIASFFDTKINREENWKSAKINVKEGSFNEKLQYPTYNNLFHHSGRYKRTKLYDVNFTSEEHPKKITGKKRPKNCQEKKCPEPFVCRMRRTIRCLRRTNSTNSCPKVPRCVINLKLTNVLKMDRYENQHGCMFNNMFKSYGSWWRLSDNCNFCKCFPDQIVRCSLKECSSLEKILFAKVPAANVEQLYGIKEIIMKKQTENFQIEEKVSKNLEQTKERMKEVKRIKEKTLEESYQPTFSELEKEFQENEKRKKVLLETGEKDQEKFILVKEKSKNFFKNNLGDNESSNKHETVEKFSQKKTTDQNTEKNFLGKDENQKNFLEINETEKKLLKKEKNQNNFLKNKTVKNPLEKDEKERKLMEFEEFERKIKEIEEIERKKSEELSETNSNGKLEYLSDDDFVEKPFAADDDFVEDDFFRLPYTKEEVGNPKKKKKSSKEMIRSNSNDEFQADNTMMEPSKSEITFDDIIEDEMDEELGNYSPNDFVEYNLGDRSYLPSETINRYRRLIDKKIERNALRRKSRTHRRKVGCEFKGKVFERHRKYEEKDHCNYCYCRNGIFMCTRNICHGTEKLKAKKRSDCQFNNMIFRHDGVTTDVDKCNTCLCEHGIVTCTKLTVCEETKYLTTSDIIEDE